MPTPIERLQRITNEVERIAREYPINKQSEGLLIEVERMDNLISDMITAKNRRELD